jgi:ABC-type nitrate/sulfonate/bicarbonate transport system substrate-binding protein
MSFATCQAWLQQGTTPRGQHPRLVLSTGHREWNHAVVALVAMGKGYFEAEGLDEVLLLAFADDEEAQLDALESGRVDIALDPATHKVLARLDRGADVAVVAPRRKSHAFTIFGQKGMRSLADLRGQTIEMIPDAEPTQQIKQLLKMHGLEWEKDVLVRYVDDVSMHDLLLMDERFLAGELTILTAHPWNADEWLARGYPLLADSSKVFAPRQDRVVVATGKLGRDHYATLTAFLKVYIKSNRFLMEPANGDEARAILEQSGFVSTQAERANWDVVLGHVRKRMSPDASFPEGSLEQVLAEQREAGAISDRLTLDRVVRLDAVQDAQRELGLLPVSV